MSANVSYEQAAKDVKYFTGVEVSASTQQRLVHRQTFEQMRVGQAVEELSVDGGSVRVRTPLGEPSERLGYKAICLHEQAVAASFHDDAVLVEWVHQQPLAATVTCLGDGHDGVWNVIEVLMPIQQRREILDWYHLVENLGKIEVSEQLKHQVEALLWQGQVDESLTRLSGFEERQTQNFCVYLEKHRHRIVNYAYYQAEGICSIASGAVESTIKQINRRLKISGAQWEAANVPQVLAHRCAYLNDLLIA
jgi:hypothetical protein